MILDRAKLVPAELPASVMTVAELMSIQSAISDRWGYGRPLKIYWQFAEDSAGCIAFTIRIGHLRNGYDLESTVTLTEELLRHPLRRKMLTADLFASIKSVMLEEQQ